MKTAFFMKLTKRYIGIIACLLLPFGVYAQKPTLNIVVPNVVSVGERFQIRFELDVVRSDIADLTIHSSLDNINIIAGPGIYDNSNYTAINGQVTSSVSTTITYTAIAQKEGKMPVVASVKIKGEKYDFPTKEIEIVKQAVGSASGEDMFVKIIVDKTTLFKGEHLVATIKLYIKDIDLRGFEGSKFPTFNGFYSQELETPTEIDLMHRENVNGKVYNTGVIRKYLLYPQHNGVLKIEPFEITLAILVVPTRSSKSPFDDFFGPQGTIVSKRLVSSPVTINVKDLPGGAPPSFTGAVGDFKLETSLSKNDVVANNAVTHTVKITGTGNFKLFAIPKPSFPTDFEVYEPKTSDNIRNSASGIAGSQTAEATIIPRSAGIYTIRPTEFSYFNPGKGEYVTLGSKEHTLTVDRDSTSTTSIAVPTNRRQDIRYIGEDIRANKFAPQSWRVADNFFFRSMTYYSLYVLALALFVVAIFILRERAKRRNNAVQTRNRKANAVAKKRLSVAGKLLKAGDIACFYEELLKASWGYLSDKLNIPVANLSRDNIREALSSKGVEEGDIDAFIAVVDECEFARYAQGTGHSEMEKVYNDAINVISKLEQKIR
ncbi:MAG: BatD family protein [Prevotellaceae bacterium]|jgi:hypothetical protein|nr:BatD family protein [Prevotellaceae bacterium]